MMFYRISNSGIYSLQGEVPYSGGAIQPYISTCFLLFRISITLQTCIKPGSAKTGQLCHTIIGQ